MGVSEQSLMPHLTQKHNTGHCRGGDALHGDPKKSKPQSQIIIKSY